MPNMTKTEKRVGKIIFKNFKSANYGKLTKVSMFVKPEPDGAQATFTDHNEIRLYHAESTRVLNKLEKEFKLGSLIDSVAVESKFNCIENIAAWLDAAKIKQKQANAEAKRRPEEFNSQLGSFKISDQARITMQAETTVFLETDKKFWNDFDKWYKRNRNKLINPKITISPELKKKLKEADKTRKAAKKLRKQPAAIEKMMAH